MMFQITLKNLRERAGLSQLALAKKIGVSQSTIGMWESGKNVPDNINVKKLADVFGTSVYRLLNDEEQDPFSKRFRERTALELHSADSADTEAAIANGFPLREIMAKTEETHPMMLEEACRISILLGTSIAELVGESESDYRDLIEDNPRISYRETEKSPDTERTVPRDEKERAIMELVSQLDDGQKDFLIALLEKALLQTQSMQSAGQL